MELKGGETIARKLFEAIWMKNDRRFADYGNFNLRICGYK
jgi:hypothetical protein